MDPLVVKGMSSMARDELQVRFALDQTVYVEPALQRADVDKPAAFYTREDYQAMKDEIDYVMANRTRHACSGEVCFRGLEGRTVMGARRLTAIRRRSRQVVLQEQLRQQESNEHDPDLLAEIYKGFSLASLSQAQRTGQADAVITHQLLQSSTVAPVRPRLQTSDKPVAPIVNRVARTRPISIVPLSRSG